MLRKYYSVFGTAYRFLDAFLLMSSWFAAYFLRKHLPLPGINTPLPSLNRYAAFSVVIFLLWGFIFSISNLYSSKRITRRTTEALQVLRAHCLSSLIFIALTYLVTDYKISRGVFLYFFFISGIALVYCRVLFRNALRKLRSQGLNVQRVLIVGTSPVAQEVNNKLSRHPELGLHLLGFISVHDKEETMSPAVERNKILGSISKIQELLSTKSIDKLVIALNRKESQWFENIINPLRDELVDIILVPDVYEYVALGCEVEDFDGLPLVSLNESPIIGLNLLLKRGLDFFLSAFALIILSPLMIFLSILIKLTSSGPVFYKQERMSINGKRFWMLKFRSMRIDQEGDVKLLTAKGDPRITAIGKFMRNTSLDELPQFLNVLWGEMSLVGPRPERSWVVQQVRNNIPRYMLKHKVKAGITGWAQVNGWRGDTSLEKRIEYDLYYIKHWSLVFDFKILLLTIFKGFINKNAY